MHTQILKWERDHMASNESLKILERRLKVIHQYSRVCVVCAQRSPINEEPSAAQIGQNLVMRIMRWRLYNLHPVGSSRSFNNSKALLRSDPTPKPLS
jgi:hypothetical protein